MSESQVDDVEPESNPNSDPDELTPEERSALYSRWFDVALDIDRLLLTLSIACFGVLGTVLAGNVLKTQLHYVWWAIACFAFLVEIALVLSVVFLNKELLTKTLEKNKPQKMPWLDRIENASRWVFFAAVVCTTVFLATVAFSQLDTLSAKSKEEIANDQRSDKISGDHGRPIKHAKTGCGSTDERAGVDATYAGGAASAQASNATSESTKAEALNPESFGNKSLNSDLSSVSLWPVSAPAYWGISATPIGSSADSTVARRRLNSWKTSTTQ